jgi:hypothetical protein
VRRTRRIGLCLLATVAGCAVAAGSASAALPEFVPGAGPSFSVKSGKMVLKTVGKQQINCLADTGSGTLVGPKTVTISIVFSSCEHLKVPCNTVGMAPGEIALAADGTLGYLVNPEVKEVGLDLATPTGAPLMEFQCGAALRGFVDGSVIGKITPVNKVVPAAMHFTLKFAQVAGKQTFNHLFGEPIDVPFTSFGGPAEESGLGSVDALKFTAALMIAA